jgi:hypothetical protein
MKKYTIKIEKIPAFGFLIGTSEEDGLVLMFPFRSIIIKKVKPIHKPVKL